MRRFFCCLSARFEAMDSTVETGVRQRQRQKPKARLPSKTRTVGAEQITGRSIEVKYPLFYCGADDMEGGGLD